MQNSVNVGNFTITNGASITGNINLQGNSKVGTMVISGDNNGTATQITGNISLANSTITNGFSIDDSKITGNISIANQSTIANGLSLSGNSTITGTINLTEKGYISSLSLDTGTITGGISLTGNANGTSDDTATIESITLANTPSTITGDINIKGNSATNNAKIGTITLESGTGIGGSIAVGDSSNNAKGTIDAITLYGNSTIAGGRSLTTLMET